MTMIMRQDAAKVRCPRCGAEIGEQCKEEGRGSMCFSFHKERWVAAPIGRVSCLPGADPKPKKSRRTGPRPSRHLPYWASVPCLKGRHCQCHSLGCVCPCHTRKLK